MMLTAPGPAAAAAVGQGPESVSGGSAGALHTGGEGMAGGQGSFLAGAGCM